MPRNNRLLRTIISVEKLKKRRQRADVVKYARVRGMKRWPHLQPSLGLKFQIVLPRMKEKVIFRKRNLRAFDNLIFTTTDK